MSCDSLDGKGSLGENGHAYTWLSSNCCPPGELSLLICTPIKVFKSNFKNAVYGISLMVSG